MAPDPGTSLGNTSSERPTQNDGSGLQSQASISGNQGQRLCQGARRGQQQDQAPKAPKFEGRCNKLKGHIYDHANLQQVMDQYLKTTYSLTHGQYSGSPPVKLELRTGLLENIATLKLSTGLLENIAKLESRKGHASITEDAADSVGLLENTQTVMFQFQSQRYHPLTLHEAKRRF
jgi:hypothetical protein